MPKSKARGIRPGVFKMAGRNRPPQYLFAETTIRPGVEDGYYRAGWVEYVGLLLTPSKDEDPEMFPEVVCPAARGGMLTYEWHREKHRHVSWEKTPKNWKKWFRKHLDRRQFALAKES